MNILYVFHSPPYGDIRTMESLDAVLTAASFDFSVKILLLGEAVFHLLKSQNSALAQQKPFTESFAGLDWFDIPDVYVDTQSLEQFHLNRQDLMCPYQAVSDTEISSLQQEAEVIFHV